MSWVNSVIKSLKRIYDFQPVRTPELSISSISISHVCGCGIRTALSPAASAGLMSERGLLPIIHVWFFVQAQTRSINRRYVSTSFSRNDFYVLEKVRQRGALELRSLLGDPRL